MTNSDTATSDSTDNPLVRQFEINVEQVGNSWAATAFKVDANGRTGGMLVLVSANDLREVLAMVSETLTKGA